MTPYKVIPVVAISWPTLLACHAANFDFISIDTEGDNGKLIRLMPQAYMKRAKMICVEYDTELGFFQTYFNSHGFETIHTTGENLIVAKPKAE